MLTPEQAESVICRGIVSWNEFRQLYEPEMLDVTCVGDAVPRKIVVGWHPVAAVATEPKPPRTCTQCGAPRKGFLTCSFCLTPYA